VGTLVSITPIEGLFIGALVKASSLDADNIGDAYKDHLQFGVGYVIPEIGHVRLQYVGEKDGYIPAAGTVSDQINAKRMEAAFAFTGVPDLIIDTGIKIYFPVTISGATVQKAFQAALGAKYTMDDLSLVGRIDTTFGQSVKDSSSESSTGIGLRINLIPSYKLSFAEVGGDIGIKLVPGTETKAGNQSITSEGGVEFGIGAWIKKSLGSGHIKTGFTLKPGKNTVFTIPVLLEYYF
jgi:hypothetical protein